MPVNWPYKTDKDLLDAGYKLRGPVRCEFCDQQLLIFQIPGSMPVFVNRSDYQPHLRFKHAEPVPVDGKTAATGERP